MTSRATYVGIPECVPDQGEVRYSASSIDHEPRPFGKNIGGGKCRVRVVAVKTHFVGPTQRRAHFRLGKGLEHNAGCPYDYERRTAEVAGQHHDVVTTKGDVCRPRLIVVPRESDDASPLPNSQRKHRSGTTPARGRVGRVQRTVQAAAAIVKLLRTFEHNEDKLERWRGVYNNQIIPWSEFHYRADEDYDRLAKRPHEGEPGHPLAVSGRVRQVAVNKGVTSVHLDTKAGARAPDGTYFNVVLRSDIPGLLTYSVGDEILAYGEWVDWEKNGRTYATLWVSNRSQSTRITHG